MPIVTITLNDRQFKLSCDTDSEKLLQHLVSKLDNKLSEIQKASPNISFELLLVLAALSQQEKIHSLETQINASKAHEINPEEEKFAETLSTIAEYLENIAQRLGK